MGLPLGVTEDDAEDVVRDLHRCLIGVDVGTPVGVVLDQFLG